MTLTPFQDATLYEDAEGDLANGSGDGLFAGKTAGALARRALVQFDVASAVPAGATIVNATLTLTIDNVPQNHFATEFRLFRVFKPWGEGASNDTGPGGAGAPAETGDATWLHTFFDTVFWSTTGGDFSGSASAAKTVDVEGPYDFSGVDLTADVQLWLDGPDGNFGWAVLGDETKDRTARRFVSRESTVADSRPSLRIEYQMGGEGEG
ncbi:MAG: DNRLRE domain-containing protein, partial [Candidatus Hydrogenedentes bacterium]|nr:DNRLRE domain-containing protein [Candidatus Hydrogenedentota bacterium]